MSRLVDSIDLGYSSPMSDIPTPPKSDIHWLHYCEHPGCVAWGAFGSPGPRGETAWHCQEHDPNGGRGSEGASRRRSVQRN